MKNKQSVYLIIGLTPVFIFGAIFIVKKYENYLDLINRYFTSAENFKQYALQNTAIYEDYKTPEIEKELRTYLLMDHLKIATDQKFEQIKNNAELEKLFKEGLLKFVDVGAEYPFYFHNVPKELRYLRGFTKEGLKLISDRFAKNLLEKQNESPDKYPDKPGDKFKVKLAISSATRPVEYQKNLRGRNENASVESTHSYGISVDIFYDEYFVAPMPGNADHDIFKNTFKNADFEKIRRLHGFALGGALRRQFQTVLSKTLIELQREHKLYAILETNQRCYHVTILP
jgi:hypothetical protein